MIRGIFDSYNTARVGKQRLDLKTFLSRLTGISTPFGGVSWKPPLDQRQVVYRLVQQLANRRFISHRHGLWHYWEAVESLNEIRKYTTRALGDLPMEAKARAYLENIRQATQEFQTFLEHNHLDNPRASQFDPEEPSTQIEVTKALRELRDVIAAQIREMCTTYQIDLSLLLVYWLPRDPVA